MRPVTSRYNFHLDADDTTVLFNARTGRVVQLRGADARGLADQLCAFDASVAPDALPPDVLDLLSDGGFVSDPSVDELSLIRDQFMRARDDTPLVVTITTTMDCNLGCYYCYESRSGDRLQPADVGAIVAHVRESLSRRRRTSLHVDWYGGEPLLNVTFLEEASAALQRLCRDMNVSYHASIISNGTIWPADPGDFVRRHRIRQVQISLDGLRENHNRRRHYRRGYEPDARAGSFDTIWNVVSGLLDHVRVDVRINIDRENAVDVMPLLEAAREAGWFRRAFPAVVQPARLSAYSERSGFMRRIEIEPDAFDRIRAEVRAWAAREGVTVEESEAPEGLPEPKTSVCAALARDSSVIGADGRLYRCGLQVGETHRAVGRIGDASDEGTDSAFWRDFDPTSLPQCRHCSFLPVCWSGCPKKHLEGDTDAIAEQGLYWRTNLPRLIANAAGLTIETAVAYGLDDQFRDGFRPPARRERCIPLRVVSSSCGR